MIERKLKPEDFGFSTSTLVLGETETTAYRGDRGKIAYDHSQETHAPVYTSLVWDGNGNIDNPNLTTKHILIKNSAVSGDISFVNIQSYCEILIFVESIAIGETVNLFCEDYPFKYSNGTTATSIPLTSVDNGNVIKIFYDADLNNILYEDAGGFSGTMDDVPDGVTYKRVTSAEKTVWDNKADQSFSVAMAVAL